MKVKANVKAGFNYIMTSGTNPNPKSFADLKAVQAIVVKNMLASV